MIHLDMIHLDSSCSFELQKKSNIIIFLISISEKLYGNKDYVEERHRHRYEVNEYFSFETEVL